MKIISVLTYPYINCLVVDVTRAESPFSFPQRKRRYALYYDAKNYDSMVHWCGLLHMLNHVKLAHTWKEKYHDGTQS